MATTSRLFARDSGSSTGLNTPTIIGISCGAAAVALFLLGLVLFVIYWKLQHRYDVEDLRLRQQAQARWTQDWDQWEGSWTEPVQPSNPQYTMDHKAAPERADSRGTSTTLRGETPHDMDTLLPRGIREMASSMPAHPAYIPKALVRGKTPPAPHDIAGTTSDQTREPVSHIQQTNSSPDDYVVRAHLDMAESIRMRTPQLPQPPRRAYSSAEPSPATSTSASASAPSTTATSMPSREGSVVPAAAGPPTQSRRGSFGMSSSPPGSRRQTQQPQQNRNRSRSQSESRERTRDSAGPPRLTTSQLKQLHGPQPRKPSHARSDQPLSGLEDMTISGPLAFAEASNAGGDWRTFRERSESGNRQESSKRRESSNRRESSIRRMSLRVRGQSSDSPRAVEQMAPWGAPAREVTIESDDSDLYG